MGRVELKYETEVVLCWWIIGVLVVVDKRDGTRRVIVLRFWFMYKYLRMVMIQFRGGGF